MKAKDLWKSLAVVVAGAFPAWLVMRLWPASGPGIAAAAEGLLWSVPFVLATSIATFTNALRVFDRIETVIAEGPQALQDPDGAKLRAALDQTERLTSGVLLNALLAVLAGVGFLLLGAAMHVPQPSWLPSAVTQSRPDLIAIAIRFGLGVLTTTLLVVQFLAVPPLVAFYRFFTVDRHLKARGLDLDRHGGAR